MSELLFRSLMFVPAHNTKLLESASKSNADVLLLDIEDSVQPTKNKQLARDNILQFISEGKFENHKIYPRVNDRESGELLKDIYQLSIKGIDGFVYPKSKSEKDVYFFSKLLETIEYEKGFKSGTFKIIPLIETSSAVLNVQKICSISSRVVAVSFGCEDFISDLGGIHDSEGNSIYVPRALIAMAAKASNIIPIDTVHINVHDLEDLEKNLIISKNLGFEGMLLLHPKELPLVHKYFSPSRSEIKDAINMLKLYDESVKNERGVAVINNKFIGPPMIISAKKIIEKAELLNKKK